MYIYYQTILTLIFTILIILVISTINTIKSIERRRNQSGLTKCWWLIVQIKNNF